jgi:hypothetical protein
MFPAYCAPTVPRLFSGNLPAAGGIRQEVIFRRPVVLIAVIGVLIFLRSCALVVIGQIFQIPTGAKYSSRCRASVESLLSF